MIGLKNLVRIGNLLPLLYSVFFNLRYLNFYAAIRLPILISSRVQIGLLCRGNIVISGKPSFGIIRIGLNCSDGIAHNKSYLSIANGARIVFKGRAKLSSGISIRIDAGEVIIGDDAFFNANCMMRCTNRIIFGKELLVGWNVSFITDDGHSYFIDSQQQEKEKPIVIGNHVWIASDTKISKGGCIDDGCVVAQNTLVNKPFKDKNVLIGGIPARVLKKNVSWIE